MKTIEISVNDQDAVRLKSILEKLDFIKSIKEKEIDPIDQITQLSESSQAEEWDTQEDSRYEKYFAG